MTNSWSHTHVSRQQKGTELLHDMEVSKADFEQEVIWQMEKAISWFWDGTDNLDEYKLPMQELNIFYSAITIPLEICFNSLRYQEGQVRILQSTTTSKTKS